MMKKSPKEITGFSAASIVGLRAAIASEKTRVQSGSPAPRPAKSSQVSNKGVSDRAKKDEEEPQPAPSKPKKVIYAGGIAYYQGEDDQEELVDVERKRWEEYERSQLANARFDVRHHDDFEDQHRRDEQEEADKREERRELIAELATDTAQGRENHRTQLAKREHSKMSRKELIQAKAKALKQKSVSTSLVVSSATGEAGDDSDSEIRESDAKRPKTASSGTPS